MRDRLRDRLRMVATFSIAATLLPTLTAEARAIKRVPCWQSMKDGRMVVEPRHARPGRFRILRYDMMQDHNLSTSGSCLITVR